MGSRSLYAPTLRRFLLPLFLITCVALAGTLGFMVVEGWGFLESLFTTVITISTIGYGLPHELTTAGTVFTIALILSALVVAGYSLSTLASFIFEGEFNRILRGRRMDQRIERLRDHVIVCGFGGVGEHVTQELLKSGAAFVLIENDPERIRQMERLGDVLHIQGDATEDETLRTAGIERARGLVAVMGEDKTNTFIVLTARSLNARLRIVARLTDDVNAAKLQRAGADEVVSTDAIGGLRMASVMLRPTVVSFLDEMLRSSAGTLRVLEVPVKEAPGLAGGTVGAARIGERTGLLLVAVAGTHGSYVFNPGGDHVLGPEDTLIVMGSVEQRDALVKGKGAARR